MNIPSYIHETAWKIYRRCAEKKLTMGRTIDGFIGGSLYVSIRIHEFPRLLDEVVDAIPINRKVIHRAIGHIVKDVLPEMGMKYKPIHPTQLIFRFGNTLKIPIKVQRMASHILLEIQKKGWDILGKDPRGIAAASLYIANNGMRDIPRVTQAEVCGVSKITEVTLRTRVKDIRMRL